MDKYKQLQEKIRDQPLIERLQKSKQIIGKLCYEGRPPKMTIPVHHTDEDIYISTTLQDAIVEINRLAHHDRDRLLDV